MPFAGNSQTAKPSVIDTASNAADKPENSVPQYEITLKKAMDMIFSVLESIKKEEGITSEKKQQKAINAVRDIRYGPEKKDYFWINDLRGKMIMHPYKPELEGKDLIDFRDPSGKRVFFEAIQICQENGEGYIEYLWPMYEDEIPVPKISLVRLFQPLNWIIGTGLYLDILGAFEIEPTFSPPLPPPQPPEPSTSAF